MAESTRTVTMPFGLFGVEQVSRIVPADEPPPLPPNRDLVVIGTSVARHDAERKVRGTACYTVDVVLPGMLYGRILRSPHANARVRAVDLAPATRHPEVRAAVLALEPGSPTAIARYAGSPVAAIAATSMVAAEEALRELQVDYEPLPFVVDMRAAQAPGAPQVYDPASAPKGNASGYPAAAGLPLAGNVRGPAVSRRGSLAAGFAQAEVELEADYATQVQTHCCLEPHAVVADWQPHGLTVYLSTQYTTGVRHELAAAFGLPLHRVRVVVDAMGGGFGSKSTLGSYGRLAVQLSQQAQRPVRIVLDRHEEQIDSGNRPATRQTVRLGARRDGTLTALAVTSHGTAGVALGAGIWNFAESLYTCPNFESAQHDVFINAGPGCAMRAPGAVPGAWAIEQAIDELAERLSLDPLLLRDRIDPSAVHREERRRGAERIGWTRRHPPGADRGPVKQGLGVAQSLWASNVQTNSSCEVRVMRDGFVEVRSSVQDIGTGTGTVIAQVVAETLGLPASAIHLRLGDTEFPAGPPSYGSRTTASITPPARTAAWRVLQLICSEVAPVLNAPPEELVARDGTISVRKDPSRSISFADATARLRTDYVSAVASRADDYDGFRTRMGDAAIARQDLGGVQFAAVAVDTETGIVRVERIVAVQDCGRPINPRQLESQVQGGVLMGLSYALFEERLLDRNSGRMLNADLEHYKIAGSCDSPSIDVVVLEDYRATSATDAYGVAEPSNIATAPAIGNAVYNAIGVRIRSLPITPAVVLQALGKVPKGNRA
jgi:xanthine dehydrogenase YagR molybdenum-binding subunit